MKPINIIAQNCTLHRFCDALVKRVSKGFQSKVVKLGAEGNIGQKESVTRTSNVLRSGKYLVSGIWYLESGIW